MKRTCKKCGVEKDIEEFVKDKRCNYGRSYCCYVCKRSISNKYNALPNQKEKSKKRFNLYYKNNKNRINKNSIIYYKNNKKRLTEQRVIYLNNLTKDVKKNRQNKYNKRARENYKKDPQSNMEHTKIWLKIQSNSLTDYYIKSVIVNKSKIKKENIPQSFVNLKREEIKIKRYLKEQAS